MHCGPERDAAFGPSGSTPAGGDDFSNSIGSRQKSRKLIGAMSIGQGRRLAGVHLAVAVPVDVHDPTGQTHIMRSAATVAIEIVVNRPRYRRRGQLAAGMGQLIGDS